MSDLVQCDEHGELPATIVCRHVVETLGDAVARGFLWSIDDDGEYQAVCSPCRAMPQAEWDESAVELGRVLCLDCFKRAALMNGVHLEVN